MVVVTAVARPASRPALCWQTKSKGTTTCAVRASACLRLSLGPGRVAFLSLRLSQCAASLHRAGGTLPAFLGLHNPRVGFARGSSSSRLKTHGALVGGTPRDFLPSFSLSLSPEEM